MAPKSNANKVRAALKARDHEDKGTMQQKIEEIFEYELSVLDVSDDATDAEDDENGSEDAGAAKSTKATKSQCGPAKRQRRE